MVVGEAGEGWIAQLQAGSGHVVGLVSAAGAPFVTRGWGIRIDDGGRHARLLLARTEVTALGHAGDAVHGTAVALTATDIRTLRSVQVKGPITSIEAADDEDKRVVREYCADFFAAVQEMDMLPPRLMERMVPDELVACTFVVTEAFDQTPGPHAGHSLPLTPDTA